MSRRSRPSSSAGGTRWRRPGAGRSSSSPITSWPWARSAISLCARQKLDEALPLFERAREADPLASFPYTLTGWGLLVSGRPEEALRHVEDALTFEKEDASAISASCMANVALGRFEEGIAAGEHGVAVSRRAPFFLGVLGWALATAGRKDEARTILEELRARPAASPTAVSEAWLLGALGEIDDAFDVLARAEEEYQGLLCYTGLPGFDPLRADPRFGALLTRLGLPPASRRNRMTIAAGTRLGPYEILGRSARAGWARCTGRRTRGSAATSRSRSCRRRSRTTRIGCAGSSRRPGRPGS